MATKKTAKKTDDAEIIDQAAEDTVADELEEDSGFALPELSNTNIALIAAFGLAVVVILVNLASGGDDASAPMADVQTSSMPVAATTPAPAPAATATGGSTNVGGIERVGEGRHFYTTIKLPPEAETLYLSGSGARANPDGTWGDMEAQTVDTFARFQETLEAQGWSMSDSVQVRAFAVAGEYGLLDFDGFNRGYRQFFGTEENPMKPVRSFVEIAGLVVPGWLVEIEIRAARVPD